MTIRRRDFLRGTAAGAAGTALAAGVLAEGARADAGKGGSGGPPASYPFHGAHQAGILTPEPAAKQSRTAVVACDLTAPNRSELTALLRTLTGRARLLTAGGPAPGLGVGQPPADSDVIGPSIPADGLTVTVSAGPGMFDRRYGLSTVRPRLLTTMPTFVNDALEPAWTGGDLLIQFCAHNPDTVHHALRDIAKHTRGGLQVRWKMEGYNPPPRPAGASRNLLGFKDGTANPIGATARSLIWVDDPAEPTWTRGGSYLAVRLIRMLVEFWDRVSINEQETMFGRRRDTGAPLDGTVETDIPNYAADPKGDVIPLDGHIRLANPRTPATANQRLLRRSYSYDLGVDPNGNMQAGHLFLAYQQDIERQFATVQRRLANEPLADYVQPFGGGYFFTLPGVRNPTDWYGSSMLSA